MKRQLPSSMSLLLLAVLWTTGCIAEPTVIAPVDETIAAQVQPVESREVLETVITVPAISTATPQREEPTTMPTPIPEPTEVKPPAEAEAAIMLSREDLAQWLGLTAEASRLVSVEAVEWSDTSLGCPQPGMMYAQVITPGFLVVLEVAGERYVYHTDAGRLVVLCEEEKDLDAGSSKGSDTTVKDGGPNQPRGGDVIIAPPTERK